MHPHETDRLFHFVFEKTCEEVGQAAAKKMTGLYDKIAVREDRLARLREEHAIDDTALIQLMREARRQQKNSDRAVHQFSYSNTVKSSGGQETIEERTIGAGVVNNLLTESDMVDADRATIKRLALMVRNLRPLDRVTETGALYRKDAIQLSYEELEYLGF